MLAGPPTLFPFEGMLPYLVPVFHSVVEGMLAALPCSRLPLCS